MGVRWHSWAWARRECVRVRAGSIQQVMAHLYRRLSALSARATRVWLCARDVTPGVAAKREIVRERRRSKIPDLAINNKKATPDRMVPVATACRALQPRASVDKRRKFMASQACTSIALYFKCGQFGGGRTPRHVGGVVGSVRADALTRRRRTSRYTCGWARAAVWCAQTRPQPLQVSRRAPFHSLAHHSTRFFPSVPLPPPTEPYVCPHVRARSRMADNMCGDDAAA